MAEREQRKKTTSPQESDEVADIPATSESGEKLKADMDDLLQWVADGEIDATLVDSNIYTLSRSSYPSVRGGFTLPGTQPQAWAFRRSDDDSLVQQSRLCLESARSDGRCAPGRRG